jgi:hypothetical protein
MAPDEETEAEPAKRKANKRKVLFRFNAELRRPAEDDIRELNTEEARIIREQNSRHRVELKAEMMPVESIQAREINATHQRAPKTRCALRFVRKTIGELEVFHTQIYRHQPPPMEEICQFCQAVKWKDETANC